MPPVRRLTAILAADVAGYSRLMGADEEGTHERLQAHLRELVNPKIADHRGRIVKNTGDGLLAEFAKSAGRPLGLPMTSLPTIYTFALLDQFVQGNGARNGIFRVSTCFVKQSNGIRVTVPPSPAQHSTTASFT